MLVIKSPIKRDVHIGVHDELANPAISKILDV
jgi:hypothetical protein